MQKLLVLICLVVLFSATQAQKKCTGELAKPATNLCQSHFPDAQSEKVWFVMFYAPWCGHCKSLKPKWTQLAKELIEDKEIGIGGIDCTQQENQGLCQKYGVKGYPTLKAFVHGKPKEYSGARETEPLKQYILGVKKNMGSAGGSLKCQKGVFVSGVKDAVVPLCSKHFPDEKSKNSWIITFYNKADFTNARREMFNEVATAFGNNPAEKLKKSIKLIKQRERLSQLAESYNLEVNIPSSGLLASTPILKAGGVCCDCDQDSKDFCAKQNISTFPTYRFQQKNGQQTNFEYSENDHVNAQAIVKFSLNHLKYLKNSGEKQDL